jgi:hypothetical protein
MTLRQTTGVLSWRTVLVAVRILVNLYMARNVTLCDLNVRYEIHPASRKLGKKHPRHVIYRIILRQGIIQRTD